ncbi:MAG TPA: hypothetical protein VNZ45_08715 [Bacteroidia bacterium]|jgi:hypothetical protein|nr:hypothetical protein [Bacteroidia bacterium]
MKRYIMVAFVLLAGIIGCNSDKKNAANMDPEKQVARLMADFQEACKLSPDQVAKVQPIVQTFVNARIASVRQYGEDKQSLKPAMEANRKNFKESLSVVLTPEQMTAFEQYMKQKAEARRNANQDGGNN